MNQLAEQFNVEVGNEVYNVTRFLEDHNDESETYGFKTMISGNEVKLSAQLQSGVISDLSNHHGIDAVKEVTNILLAEFRLDISKLKESH